MNYFSKLSVFRGTPSGFLVLILAASVAGAQPPLEAPESSESFNLGLHGGVTHVFDGPEEAGFVSLELRLRDNWRGIRPWTSVFLVDRDNTWAIGGGLMFEGTLGGNWRLAFGTGPFYYHPGHGPDLGYDLQFYSFIEPVYLFANGGRVGIRLGHFSNAGLSEYNPGTETLALTVSFPFGGR